MLTGARMALWGGRRSPLPPGARWVEYLESTGTQYILLPANNYDGIDIMLEPADGSTYGNIGRRTGTRADTIGFTTTTGWLFRAYSAVTQTNDTNRSLRHATVHGTTATLDGVSYTLANGWNTVAFANKPFALFGLFNPSTQEMFSWVSCKIGACALYVGNEKVYDFRPIAIGTTGYMLDMVSGQYLQYGNAGTGDFVLGPDIVPVEWLESDGGQYIDTGFVATSATKVQSSCALLRTTSAYPAMWGARTTSKVNDFQIYYNTNTVGGTPTAIVLRTGTSDKQVSRTDIRETTLLGARLDITAESGSLTVNGYNFTTPAFNFTTPHSLLAFCEYTGGAIQNFGAFKYWALNIWDNGDSVRKFAPVRVGSGSTWEGAMMDTLTRRIYRNAGTGAFTYGNDLPLETLAN